MPRAEIPDSDKISQHTSNTDSTSFKLFRDVTDKKLNYYVQSVTQQAKITEAVAKQSNLKQLEDAKDALQERHEEAMRLLQEEHAERLAAAEDEGKTASEVAALKRELQAEERSLRRSHIDEMRRAEQQLVNQQKANETRIAEISKKNSSNNYKRLSLFEKQKHQEAVKNAAKEHQQELIQQKQANQAALAILKSEARSRNTSAERRLEIEREVSQINADQAKIQEKINASKKIEAKANKESAKLIERLVDVTNDSEHIPGLATKLSESLSSEYEQLQAGIKNAKIELATTLDPKQRALIEAQIKADEETAASMKESLDKLSGAVEKDKDAAHKEDLEKIKSENPKDRAMDMARDAEKQEAQKKADAEARKYYLNHTEAGKKERNEQLLKELTNVLNDLSKQVDQDIASFYQYQAEVEARLEGSSSSYQKSLRKISDNLMFSPLYSQKAVIENLKKLVDAGIAYNLDLRAFLATASDRIVNTFDVFDSNLMRLIRLQQADSTAARLGLESKLNQLFNKYFSDSSYLSDAFDSVSQSIIEANAQMSDDMSIQFEYIVQKWLGALYSLGMGSDTINTIAQGITHLATGNVEDLNSNESLQNLLAMSATRAGLSYADILIEGLNPSNTNKLLQSMVEYLQEIAQSAKDNQVVKSAYGDVFGFNLSDLVAVQNLNTSQIASSTLSYGDAVGEVNTQLAKVFSRTHLSTMASTLTENIMASVATGIGNSVPMYVTWMAANMVQSISDIFIPFISAAGFGLDLNMSIPALIKGGVMGLSLLGSIISAFASPGGGTGMDAWGFERYNSRGGGGIGGLASGSSSGVSSSSSLSFIGSSDPDDIKSTTITDASDEAIDEDDKIINQELREQSQSTNDALIDEASGTDVITELIEIRKLLREDRLFKIHGLSGGGSGGSSSAGGGESAEDSAAPISLDNIVQELITSNSKLDTVIEELVKSNESIQKHDEIFKEYLDLDRIFKIPQIPITVTLGTKPSSSTGNRYPNSYYDPYYSYINPDNFYIDDVTHGSPTYGDIDNSEKDNSTQDIDQTVITKLENIFTTTNLETITSLMAAISAYSDYLNNNAGLQKYVNVSVANLAPEVSSHISDAVRATISSLLESNMHSSENEDKNTVIDQLRRLFESQEIGVRVKNDYFDDFYRKQSHYN